MDIRKRAYIGIATADDRQIVGVNIPELLRHLLLFEGVTIRSGRILDLAHLVRLRGLSDALAVIAAGGLAIHCDPASLVRAGEPRVVWNRNGVLRLERLDYGIVRMGEHDDWLDSGFREARVIAGLDARAAREFESAVRSRLLPPDLRSREDALAEAKQELQCVGPTTRASIDVALRKHCGIGLPVGLYYALSIQHIDGAGFVAETDLPRVLNLPAEAVARALNDGLLGVFGIHQTVDDMRVHQAMVGFQERELPVFERKLNFLAGQLNASVQAGRLARVAEVLELPDVSNEIDAHRVGIQRLLEVRETDECKAFRDWLWSSSDISEVEIRERFESVRVKLGAFLRTKEGKTIRWLVGTGIGVSPGVGTILGGIVGLIDTFLAERVLPGRGALTFLGGQYRSIFK